ncbi:hypothetical protein WMY93_028246 [Mugilogobius chulae]|uniref:Alpha-2-macroglobulin-like n=1 Tax=Mugilogobius chulae TaxID=88201 RepID=A0AAW0MSE7_9GOBI
MKIQRAHNTLFHPVTSSGGFNPGSASLRSRKQRLQSDSELWDSNQRPSRCRMCVCVKVIDSELEFSLRLNMGRPDSVRWTGLLLLLLGLSLRSSADPHYAVVFPAVVESGSRVPFCLSLMGVSEDLTVTVSVDYADGKIEYYRETHDEDTHKCGAFQAPVVENSDIWFVEVEVKGKTFHKIETTRIQIQNYGVKSFIQTDKPLYLPGQKVHFRVVTLDSKLRPANASNPQQNRVAQWLNRRSDGRILQLSYELDPQAKEGFYSVSVNVQGVRGPISHSFQVEKYVLPKFSAEVEAPDEVSVALEKLSLKVCGKYTFGQSVPGKVELSVCRYPGTGGYWILDPYTETRLCVTEEEQTSKDGCASFSVQTAQFLHFSRMEDEYFIRATLTEEGTDLTQTVEKRVKLSYQIGKVEFVDPPKMFNTGDVLDLQVKAVHYNDTPVSHADIYLRTDYERLPTLQTDENGLVTFKFNTSGYPDTIYLRVSLYSEYKSTYQTPHFSDATLTVEKLKPPSLHTRTTSAVEIQPKELLVCGAKESFDISYTLVDETQGVFNLVYMVMSRGVILKYAEHSNYMTSTTQGELMFKMDITPDMAPVVTLVVYAVLPSESVIADTRDFLTEKCLNNKVQLQFSPPSSVPGDDSSLKVSTAPQSLCGVSAVDKSVLIQKPGKGLDPDKILSLLPVKHPETFPYQLEDPLGCVKVRSKRQLYPIPGRNPDNDVYSLLKKRGLKMITNLFIRTPTCVNFRGTEYHLQQYHMYAREYSWESSPRLGSAPMGRMGPMGPMGPSLTMSSPQLFGSAAAAPPPPPPPPPVQTVRNFFPETWIWDLVEVGDSGHALLPLTVPDTITTWETEAFCLSPVQGIGLAPRQQLTVFQPFFLELTLPYSIIRGETFELKATVFNYLSLCMMMKVEAAPSLDFTLTPLSSDQYTSCLCGNERKTLSWTLVASALGKVNVTVRAEAIPSSVQCNNEIVDVPDEGRIDVVTKPLRVKAEGAEVSKAYNLLLCPKGEPLKEQVELILPENVIQGSARASVSVLGDILGRAMKNLDGLLKMPYGCGEQNMALLAPNIYILQYLKETQQLSPEVEERALKFLSSGYQRQLNYKHRDHSYSAFGRGDGNTWLTAFVVRCFAKARAFIYIDPARLHDSRVWLQGRQKKDGCFLPSGKLFNNRMKGGVSDDVTLSAYITTAFLEMNMSTTERVVRRSLSCLKSHSQNLENIYTTALMAYVFSLAGDTETRAQLLGRLRSQATDEGGLVHWSGSSDSLSVEICSYVLLSTLTQPSVSAEDLGYASKMVRWLTGQQNSYGGFKSTQDTVVALQALALYSTLVYSRDGSSSVLVQNLNRPTEGSLSFTVEPDNKLLYQERALESAVGQFSLEVNGDACVSAQISLHYNIPPPSEARYFGELNSTNMVILDVKLLSGFVSGADPVETVEIENKVDRVEVNKDHVLIYIRELTKEEPMELSLTLTQETLVQNLKPAVVKIYDYYQPSDQMETDYTSPCAEPSG